MKKSSEGNKTKYLFRWMGPNFILAILLVGWILYHYRDRLFLNAWNSSNRPAVSQAGSSPGSPDSQKGLYRLYNPDRILDYRGTLGLTENQTHEIRDMLKSWEKETRDINIQLVEETRTIEGYLSGKSSYQNTGQIQSRAKDYSLLSGELAEIRHHYWNKILTVLTREQKSILENGGIFK